MEKPWALPRHVRRDCVKTSLPAENLQDHRALEPDQHELFLKRRYVHRLGFQEPELRPEGVVVGDAPGDLSAVINSVMTWEGMKSKDPARAAEQG